MYRLEYMYYDFIDARGRTYARTYVDAICIDNFSRRGFIQRQIQNSSFRQEKRTIDKLSSKGARTGNLCYTRCARRAAPRAHSHRYAPHRRVALPIAFTARAITATRVLIGGELCGPVMAGYGRALDRVDPFVRMRKRRGTRSTPSLVTSR